MYFIFVHNDNLLFVLEFNGVSFRLLLKNGSKLYYKKISHPIHNLFEIFNINIQYKIKIMKSYRLETPT